MIADAVTVIKSINLIFIFIGISAIFKAISDSIKPDQFDYTIFKKWKGNKWLDFRVAHVNDNKLSLLLYPFLVHFVDAWHFSNSVMVSNFLISIICALNYNMLFVKFSILNNVILFLLLWFWFGIIFEIFYKLFRNKWLIKNFI